MSTMSKSLMKCCDSTFTLNDIGNHIIASHHWRSTDKLRCTCTQTRQIKALLQHLQDARVHKDDPEDQKAVETLREQRNSATRRNANASAAPKPEQQGKKPGDPPKRRKRSEWEPPKLTPFENHHANCQKGYCVWVEDDCPELANIDWVDYDF